MLFNLERIQSKVTCLWLQAEARLAAKRQARAEAREIRMRELERMQRENEDGDKVYDIYSTPGKFNLCYLKLIQRLECLH